MKVNRFTYRLLINRRLFTLEVRKLGLRGYKLVHRYSISVGIEGHETPRGTYKIISKVFNPTWTIPNTKWARDAGLTPGDTIPGDDLNNPIKVAFLQLTQDPTGNIGIHGTSDLGSLRSAASHGCIRVAPEVALHLYRTIPKGTVVRIIA